MTGKLYRRILAIVMITYALMWCLTYITSCKRIGPNGKCLDYISEENTTSLRQVASTSHVPARCTKKPETTDPFTNALKHGKTRTQKGFLTIGIPTMKRPANQTYLWQTLHSLLNNSNDAEKNETVIVIFLSDFDEASKEKLSAEILQKYEFFVNSGLIQIIEAPRDYYPSLENLKRTYNHPMKQVVWRSKQNIDYAFMMKYSTNISQYYLQLEDDVLTVPDYIPKIKTFIEEQKGAWVCLEFSELGYIGKLYRSTDLEKLASLLTLFYSEQPNDVTYLHFNRLMLQRQRKIRKPTIFQHQGFYSTLTIKKSKLKDKFFETSEQEKATPKQQISAKKT